MRAIRISEWGGPDVLELVEDAPMPEPADHELLVRVSRAGVNYADTHARENSYLAPYALPLIPGAEVAGTAEDGRRVVGMIASGGYAEYAAVPTATAFDIPDGVSDAAALALRLDPTHPHRLAPVPDVGPPGRRRERGRARGGRRRRVARRPARARVRRRPRDRHRVERVQAGAGARARRRRGRRRHARGPHRGADRGQRRPAGRRRARDGGRPRVRRLAAGAGAVRAACTGMASREEPRRIAPGNLLRHSGAVIGFWLAHCLSRPEEMLAAPLRDLFRRVARGDLRVVEGHVYPLSEVARAHSDLQARRTTGKLLLDPAS